MSSIRFSKIRFTSALFAAALLCLQGPSALAGLGSINMANIMKPVLNRIRLHNEYTVYLLNRDVRATILEYSAGAARDRIQIRIAVVLDDGRMHELWIHYEPDLTGYRQGIELLNAKGVPTTDLSKASTVLTKVKGISAWDHMEHETDAVADKPISHEKVLARAKALRISRKTASTPPVSTQPLKGGRFWSYECEDFIDSHGHYGKWGEALLNMANSGDMSTLYGGDLGDIGKICPKYSKFDEAQRKNFWVWFAASVAMVESTCNPEISVHGTDGIASGLWQLDLHNHHPIQKKVCGYINTTDGKKNVTCGIRMLNWYTGIDIRNKRNLVYWWGNYWESLHPRGTLYKTSRLVRQYRACFK